MSLVKEQAAFLRDVARLIEKATELGFDVTGGELYRTPEQQDIYVRAGRSKTFNSMHLKRLAIDLYFFRNGVLAFTKDEIQQIGVEWEAMDPKNKWGGNWKSFKDLPHFERKV